MFKKIGMISALWILALPSIAVAENDLPYCDLLDEKKLIWTAIDEEVTVRTELKGSGYPRGKLYIVFGDGHEILISEGGKYLDDAEDIGCEAQLNAATISLFASLEGQGVYFDTGSLRTMNDLDQALQSDEACKLRDKQRHESPDNQSFLDKVRQTNMWETQFLSCQAILDRLEYNTQGNIETTIEDYKRLLSQNAPLIEVAYSAYGVDIMAFDREKREFYKLYYSGC